MQNKKLNLQQFISISESPNIWDVLTSFKYGKIDFKTLIHNSFDWKNYHLWDFKFLGLKIDITILNRRVPYKNNVLLTFFWVGNPFYFGHQKPKSYINSWNIRATLSERTLIISLSVYFNVFLGFYIICPLKNFIKSLGKKLPK